MNNSVEVNERPEQVKQSHEFQEQRSKEYKGFFSSRKKARSSFRGKTPFKENTTPHPKSEAQSNRADPLSHADPVQVSKQSETETINKCWTDMLRMFDRYQSRSKQDEIKEYLKELEDFNLSLNKVDLPQQVLQVRDSAGQNTVSLKKKPRSYYS